MKSQTLRRRRRWLRFLNTIIQVLKHPQHHPIISVDYNLVHIHVHTHKSLRPRGPDLFQLEELPAKDFKEGAEIGPSLTDLDVRFAMLCESLYIEKDDVDISGDAPTEAEQMGVYFAPGNNRQRKPATERCRVCGLRHFSSPCGRPKSEQEKVAKRDKVEEVAKAQDGTEATEHSQTSKTCQYCGGSHTTANCQLLPQMRAIHERHLARQANGQASEVQTGTSSSATSSSLSCTICLRKGHGPWDCPERFTKPARTSCPVCGRRHWKVNCPETSDNKRRLRRIQGRHSNQAQVGIPEGSQLSAIPLERSPQELDVTVEGGDSSSQPRGHDDPGDIRRLSKLSEGISIEYHT
jgi:pterin-4a-carbinolamine dehydratase